MCIEAKRPYVYQGKWARCVSRQRDQVSIDLGVSRLMEQMCVRTNGPDVYQD